MHKAVVRLLMLLSALGMKTAAGVIVLELRHSRVREGRSVREGIQSCRLHLEGRCRPYRRAIKEALEGTEDKRPARETSSGRTSEGRPQSRERILWKRRALARDGVKQARVVKQREIASFSRFFF